MSLRPSKMVISSGTEQPDPTASSSGAAAASSVPAEEPKVQREWKSSPYQYIFICFIFENFLTLADRSIIAGSSREFARFIGVADDSPDLLKESPDAGIGILSAAFIGGYAVAIVISGHLVHKIKWKTLVIGGLMFWIISLLGSGLSYYANSYWMLFFSRLLSGVSEASFHVIAPPMIQQRGGINGGKWLAAYLAAMPVGLAFGYIYGSRISNNPNLGWPWAYFFEIFMALPLVLAFACIRDDENGGIFSPDRPAQSGATGCNPVVEESGLDDVVDSFSHAEESQESDSMLATTDKTAHRSLEPPIHFTIQEEMKVCLSSEILIYISLAQAVFASVTVALGTFGGAIILALQMFDTEQEAAMLFSVAAAVAGTIGTPLGGIMVDKVQDKVGEYAPSSEVLTALLPRVNSFCILGTLFCWPTCLVRSPWGFLFFISCGWLCLFIAQSGIQWSVMLSVDPAHRPNAVAFAMFNSHILGDVPFPIVFGALKDYLAPACNINAEGQFVDEAECASQHTGIRASLAFAWAYMTFAVLFLEVARRYAQMKCEKDLNRGIDAIRNKGEFDQGSFHEIS